MGGEGKRAERLPLTTLLKWWSQRLKISPEVSCWGKEGEVRQLVSQEEILQSFDNLWDKLEPQQ